MAPFNSTQQSRSHHLPAFRPKEGQSKKKKFRTLKDVMKRAKRVAIPRDDYSKLMCSICGSGEKDEEILLCDGCDNGFHMMCLRPVVVRVPIGSWYCNKCHDHHPTPIQKFTQRKIMDFFRIRKSAMKCISPEVARRQRKRSRPLVLQKKSRKLLPYIPTEDHDRRSKQMESLASALINLKLEFSNDLTYFPGMAPKSANQSNFESGGMQVMSKEDIRTLEKCKAMAERGEYPPLRVVFDPLEGYTVEVDAPIKHMTFIAEYTGDVDYIRNRADDDSDSMMTLLLASDPLKSLVICPDKRGNITRFINGINNHTEDGKKKQNLKCVRYSVKGECHVFLVASRNIAKGERLYYNYNGYENAYPTQHFV
ncbi:putative Histone-lysine N-methyltransferase ATXR5 [Apium graveolens]|uniref:putative Histone-lysine N-methyltransferase ATXR5 n=1 Tax=Apium graveolens TaxID=4045 RepID=UPI003D79CE6B